MSIKQYPLRSIYQAGLFSVNITDNMGGKKARKVK
jgi:hypothetical protein